MAAVVYDAVYTQIHGVAFTVELQNLGMLTAEVHFGFEFVVFGREIKSHVVLGEVGRF